MRFIPRKEPQRPTATAISYMQEITSTQKPATLIHRLTAFQSPVIRTLAFVMIPTAIITAITARNARYVRTQTPRQRTMTRLTGIHITAVILIIRTLLMQRATVQNIQPHQKPHTKLRLQITRLTLRIIPYPRAKSIQMQTI